MRKILLKFFRWSVEKKEINYLYFSLLLFFISLFALIHFLFLERPLFGIPLFFLIHSLGQGLLEVGIFVLTAYLLNRWAPVWLYSIFVSLSFTFLLYHFTDFTMIRILDTPISYLFKFFFGSGLRHIGTAFLALNMNFAMVATSFTLVLLIPLAGIAIYRLTQRITRIRPMRISLRPISLFLLCTGSVLFLLDLCAYPFLSRLAYAKHQKSLPFGTTFLSPPQKCIPLPSPIAPPRSEKQIQKNFPSLSAGAKPNLYLFVIETLRKDFVNREIAPSLTAFADENIQFPHSFANANCTQLSWFAIFHSDFPYHWTAMRDEWKKGSVSLQLLKKLGYKIRVYSSADLSYFSMDKVIFGEKLQIGDQIEEYAKNRTAEPWERDALALQSFERDLKSQQGREGNLYLFFLDATHSEYSFPPDFPLKFEPISKQIDYLTLTQNDIEPIKNRYRNSIAYIDSLMGGFFDTLKRENLSDSAVIAITGDHGEEFFEDGALFHGTHLNHFQTSVPLFFKFQDNPWPVKTTAATHIDIFPSILHYLTKESDFQTLFDGQSIFSDNRSPYRIAVLQNGPDTPCEFTLMKEGYEIYARFLNPRNIYTQTRLEILSLTMPGPLPNDTFENILQNHFAEAFLPLLKNPARD